MDRLALLCRAAVAELPLIVPPPAVQHSTVSQSTRRVETCADSNPVRILAHTNRTSGDAEGPITDLTELIVAPAVQLPSAADDASMCAASSNLIDFIAHAAITAR